MYFIVASLRVLIQPVKNSAKGSVSMQVPDNAVFLDTLNKILLFPNDKLCQKHNLCSVVFWMICIWAYSMKKNSYSQRSIETRCTPSIHGKILFLQVLKNSGKHYIYFPYFQKDRSYFCLSYSVMCRVQMGKKSEIFENKVQLIILYYLYPVQIFMG